MAMHPNEALIKRFYDSFAGFDPEGMVACYADDIVFTDPVFGELRGERAKGMWRMLMERSSDLELQVSDIKADDRTGSARWIATYTFSRTGRRVRNVIDARFEFKDGRIVRHDDSFNLRRWCRMALGLMGLLFGWTPMLQGKVRGNAARGLAHFMDRQHEST